MSKSRELGELGQLITVNTTSVSVGNTVMHTNGITVGNTSIHSNGISISGQSINNTSYPGTANNANNLNGVPASSYVNTSGSYTISGVHTHNANIVIGSGVSLQANGTVGDAGQSLVSNGSSVYWTTAGATLNANNTDSQTFYVGLSNSSTGAWTNAVVATSKLNFVPSTGTLTVDSATVNATNYSGTANNTLYVGSVTAANVVSNAQLQANVSTLQGQITSNASAAYTNATIFASNASNVNTGTLAEARLPYRMNQNVRNTDTVEFNGMTLTGNLVVSGNVNIIGANNLSVSDNMIYLNSNNDVSNPDLGFAGNYNDGTYRHTGFFRDATDGFWKVFDNYGPEPDASPYIDTSNSTFHIANFWANTIYVGNTSVYASVNTTNFSGTANNTTYAFGKSEGGINANSALNANNSAYLGGTAAASYLLSSTASSTYAPLSGATFSGDVRTYRSASTGTGVYYFSQSGDYYLYWSGSSFNLNGGYTVATGSMRSPLFYDSDNTSYYVDAASKSRFNTIDFGTSTYYIGAGSWGMRNTTPYGYIEFGPANADWAHIYTDRSSFYFNVNTSCDIGYGRSSLRAPVFYDSDNTGYYVDSASTSLVNVLGVGTTGYFGRLRVYNGGSTAACFGGGWGEYGKVITCRTDGAGAQDGPMIHFFKENAKEWGIGIRPYSGDNGFWIAEDGSRSSWGTERFRMDPGGASHFYVDIRSPIFYDENDTYYYNDLNSSRRFAGRTYIHEWIEFVNYTGLYSPNNGAHFYPNPNSYGAWRLDGSRNGWQGIEFSAQATLMMNDDVYGIHRNTGGDWRLYVNGSTLYVKGNVVAYWSDRRLKENLRPIGKEALEILSAFTTYRFNWNHKVEDFMTSLKPGKEEIGLIAQEVQEKLPDAVVVNECASTLNPDGSKQESSYLTINYDKITPIVVQALNETVKELNELKQLLKDKGII